MEGRIDLLKGSLPRTSMNSNRETTKQRAVRCTFSCRVIGHALYMSKLEVKKVEVLNAIRSLSHSPGHARHVDSASAVARSRPWLRHRATGSAGLTRNGTREPGFVVPSVASPRTKALAEIRMAAVGNRPRGQVLCAHASRP